MKTKKNENAIIIFLKGFVIGFGIIFPISSSVLAMTMGIYEKIINIINNFFSSFKKNKKFIIAFALGVVASAICCCLLLNITLNKYPVATLLFFTGLIFGGVQLIIKKTEKKLSLSNIGCTIIGALLLISLSFIGNSSEVIISTNLIGYIKIFLVGLVSAGTMIIPGVSGSAILVILGYYTPLLAIISDTIHLTNLNPNIFIILVFGIGMILGIILMSKLMEYLLNKHKIKTYFAIVGFVIASIINIIILIFSYEIKIVEFIVGLILFIIGYFISAKLLKEDN
ncbi:MAG: DUF368 domain-containing protein [Bacilli bacterium]